MTRLAGRTRVEPGTHFEIGDATLSEHDRPLLDDSATPYATTIPMRW